MKKDTLSGLDIDLYSEKFANGFEVYLVPLKNMKRYYATYATKYGSLITEFCPNGSRKNVKVPNGIAHFLEHKMFEQESGIDPFSFYSQSGCYVNASTGFESTRYICSGNTKFRENLDYLLNFVNSPYFTDENVEKEKGIIIEEVNMYKDMVDSAIDDTTRKCIFQKDHHKYDIGGEVDEVKSITKEDLYSCYDNFYQPNNMFILIVGNFSVETALDVIRERVENRENKYKVLPKIKKEKEPYAVAKKCEVVKFNIDVSKLTYSFKMKKKDFNIQDDYILDLYLAILLKILFGSTSIFSEKAKMQDLYSEFYYNFDSTDDYLVLNFYGESKKQNELLSFIKETLLDRENIINEDDFIRSKKVMIANKIKASCYIDAVGDSLYEDLINYNKIITNKVDLIRQLKYENLLKVSNNLDLSNNSIVCYVPKDDNFEIKN